MLALALSRAGAGVPRSTASNGATVIAMIIAAIIALASATVLIVRRRGQPRKGVTLADVSPGAIAERDLDTAGPPAGPGITHNARPPDDPQQ